MSGTLTPATAASVSRSLPPTPNEQARSYRCIQLDDIRPSPTTAIARASHPHHHQAIIQHKDSFTALSHHNHGARTIGTIKASHAASTSIERSDHHRAMIHHRHGDDILSLRERYNRNKSRTIAPQKTAPAGSEFGFMWDALDKLKRTLLRALNRRAKKNEEARKAKQKQSQSATSSRLAPVKERPLPPAPTPIYDAHRKHRSKPAPKEFYLAWAAIKDQPRATSPSPLSTITRKPVPETAPQCMPKLSNAGTEPPQALRRSHSITLDEIATTRTMSRSKSSRLTHFSDFMRPRVQSNILTGSNKQSRPCDVCGSTSSTATGATLSKEGLWLCAGCQGSDGLPGELPPLSPKLGQRHQLQQPAKARVVWDIPVGKDLVWNCEHCFASFSSAPPASDNLCICPMCNKTIAAHPNLVSRTASKTSKSSNVSRQPSGLSTNGNQKSHFSRATEGSDMPSAVYYNDRSRSSIYRPSLYEDEPAPVQDSPVSPIGHGKFDNVDNSTIHPALRPLPRTPGLPRIPSMKQPDTERWNNISTRIPGIDTNNSRQSGPVTHLAYEFPSSFVAPSAATTAMDLSLPLTSQVPETTSTVKYFKSKTEQRKKEAQYEKPRGLKHMASSIYPEDEIERVYTDNKNPLPEILQHYARRGSFYPIRSGELSKS